MECFAVLTVQGELDGSKRPRFQPYPSIRLFCFLSMSGCICVVIEVISVD